MKNEVLKKNKTHLEEEDEEEIQTEYIEVTSKQQLNLINNAKKVQLQNKKEPPAVQETSHPKKQNHQTFHDDRQQIKPKFIPKTDYQEEKNHSSKQGSNIHKKYQEKKQQVSEKKTSKYQEKPSYQSNNERQRYTEKYEEKKQKQQRPEQQTNFNKNNFSVQFSRVVKEDKKDNYVYIKNKSKQQYIEIAKEKLAKYDFIGIMAYGTENVSLAFEISEEMANNIQNLRRINIPSTIQVREIYEPLKSNEKKFEKITTKGAILIEMSKKHLDARHMGYQAEKQKQKHISKKYKEKEKQEDDDDREHR